MAGTSVKRPSRRYIGFRYRPEGSSRGEVARALERAWQGSAPQGGAGAPRLLVCEAGAGILVVATPQAAGLRAAIGRGRVPEASVRMEPVVTSGTIATVKEAMGLERARRR